MTIDINKLRRLAQAATPGPWYATGKLTRYVEARIDGGLIQEVAACGPTKADGGYGPQQEANARLIAAANPATISELLDRLEAAEKERESWKGLAKQFGNELDTMRARIEEMEQQEPARLVTAVAYRWRYRGAIKWQYGELTEEVARLAKEHNHEVQPLGILPDAQPAPSIPEGWKLVPTEVIDMYSFMCAAFVPVTPQHEEIAIQLDLAKRAMLAVAPEAKP